MNLRNHIPRIVLTAIILSSLALMIGAAMSDSPAVGELENLRGYNLYMGRGITILSALFLLILLYFWAKKLLGETFALVPVLMTAFSPTFIAYGHYFTPDILKTFGLLIFAYILPKILFSLKTYFRDGGRFRASFYALVALIIAGSFFYFNGFGSVERLIITEGWIEFLRIYFFKEILPFLILIFIALIAALKNIVKKIPDAWRGVPNYFLVNPAEFSMMILIPVYIALLVMQSKIELSYVFAIFPLVYILTTSGLKNIMRSGSGKDLKHGVAFIMLSLGALNAGLIYPYYIAYLNEISVLEKNRIELGAKYDIGVDLKRLASWLNENKITNGKIGLDYYGDVDPKKYLDDKYIPWKSSYGEPFEIKLDYIGISIRKIYDARRSHSLRGEKSAEDQYLWLNNIEKPDYKIGSIWMYKIKN